MCRQKRHGRCMLTRRWARRPLGRAGAARKGGRDVRRANTWDPGTKVGFWLHCPRVKCVMFFDNPVIESVI
eukprot:1473915-Rhodomonas_salina.1